MTDRSVIVMPKLTLDKIDPAKRDRILAEAARLFAERGFSHTDMAELAKRANVAKGSLYNYFENKDELYRFVCTHGLTLSRNAVYGQLDPHWDIYQQLEHIFRKGLGFAESHPEFIALYLNVASAGMDHFAEQLSRDVEKHTADHLKAALRAGQRAGIVRKDLHVGLAAFHINSLYILFLASLVSRHFKIRMAEYLELPGEPTADGIEAHLTITLQMIADTLRPQPASSGPRRKRKQGRQSCPK